MCCLIYNHIYTDFLNLSEIINSFIYVHVELNTIVQYILYLNHIA